MDANNFIAHTHQYAVNSYILFNYANSNYTKYLKKAVV